MKTIFLSAAMEIATPAMLKTTARRIFFMQNDPDLGKLFGFPRVIDQQRLATRGGLERFRPIITSTVTNTHLIPVHFKYCRQFLTRIRSPIRSNIHFIWAALRIDGKGAVVIAFAAGELVRTVMNADYHGGDCVAIQRLTIHFDAGDLPITLDLTQRPACRRLATCESLESNILKLNLHRETRMELQREDAAHGALGFAIINYIYRL